MARVSPDRVWRAALLLAVALAALIAPAAAHADRAVVDRLAWLQARTVDGRYQLGVVHRGDADAAADERWTPAIEAIVHLPAASETTIASRAVWRFLGPTGAPVWRSAAGADAARASGNVLLGWATATIPPELADTSFNSRYFLRAVQAPPDGKLFAHSTNGASISYNNAETGKTNQLSLPPDPNGFRTDTDGHVWSFTAPGYYCADLEFVAAAYTGGATLGSARAPLAIAVGDVDPSQAPVCTRDYTATSVDLSTSPALRSPVGADVALRATVQPVDVPGTVRFHDGTQELGSAPVAGGQAQLTTAALGVGRHQLRAEFVPDDPQQGTQSATPVRHYDVYTPERFVFEKEMHADLIGVLEDGQLQMRVRKSDVQGGGNVSLHRFDESIVYVPGFSQTIVPEGSDYRFLGTAGQPLWRIPHVRDPRVIWLGLGEVQARAELQRNPSWRLEAATGPGGTAAPGEIVLWQANVLAGAQPLLSTRVGLPAVLQAPWAHAHTSWDFSAPGVYCLHLSLAGRTAGGGTTTDRGALTVVVGDEEDPYGTAPCRPEDAPARTHARELADAPAGTRVVAAHGQARGAQWDLTPRLGPDGLDVAFVHADPAAGGTAHDPEDVVVHVGPTAARPVPAALVPWVTGAGTTPWQLTDSPDALNRPRLGVDSSLLADGALDGDALAWRLEEVQGPGEVVVYDTRGQRGLRDPRALLSTRPGYESSAYPVWAGRWEPLNWSFSAPGVYCVRTEWTGTLTDGARPVADETLLTFVVGDRDPASVTPCAKGGSADPPAPDTPPAVDAPPVFQAPPEQVSPPPPPPGQKAVVFSLSRVRASVHAARVTRAGAITVRCRRQEAGRCRAVATVSVRDARRLGLRVAKGARRVTVGRGTVTLKREGRAALRVRLSATAARRLRATRRAVRIQVAVTADRAAGLTAASRTTTITVRP